MRPRRRRNRVFSGKPRTVNCEPDNLSYLYFTLYPAIGQALTSMITDTYYQRCRLYPFFQAVSSTSHYCPVLAGLSGEQDSLFRSRFFILLRHYGLPLYTHLPIFIKPFRMLTSTRQNAASLVTLAYVVLHRMPNNFNVY